jgi:hypothetical protein
MRGVRCALSHMPLMLSRCILESQEFTNPRNGPMNLATYLPEHFVPPDLGPKSYIAYGSKTENAPHDSVTRMHEDLCDAVNVLLYAARDKKPLADDDECARQPLHCFPLVAECQ